MAQVTRVNPEAMAAQWPDVEVTSKSGCGCSGGGGGKGLPDPVRVQLDPITQLLLAAIAVGELLNFLKASGGR